MTKYLFFALLIGIFILLVFILSPFISNLGRPKPASTPSLILTAPVASPTPFPTSISTIPPSNTPPSDQIRIQSQADQDFATKTNQIKTLYPWLNKLPIQTSNYYVYFDVSLKQFIAKLYPSSASTTPVDQQVDLFKNDITTKLQNLIPDYTKYNITWDIKPE